MKVFTHYPALAPAIQQAGFKPVLLEPLDLPPGAVKMTRRGDVLVISAGLKTIMFQQALELHGWELVE